MLKSKKENGEYAHEMLSGVGDRFYCVAIAFASGGFDALKELIASIPNNVSTVSFFVAQPLEVEQINTLVETIPAGSPLSIRRAMHLEPVQPGIIYIIMPDESMELTADGFIKILPLQTITEGVADVLFQSLAILCGQFGIAIVLSGTGSDGAAGLKFIHQAGGKVLVQTPQTAHYSGMPLAAIATQCVAAILPVYQMGNAIQKFYVQSFGSKINTAAKSRQNPDGKNKEGDENSIELKEPATIDKQPQNLAIISIEAMVKDTIFNSYHYTYIVLDNEYKITAINGDTALYFRAINSSCINQNIWAVLNEAFKQEVHIAFTNAVTGQQLAAGNEKVVVQKGRLIFSRILVKVLDRTENATAQYVIILEKIETDQLVNTNILETNKAATHWAMKKLTVQLKQPR